MKKDFDLWNKVKKTVHARTDTEKLFFRERETWWAHLGVNVGFEQDGTGQVFERPVVIIKKYNPHIFLTVPLSTTSKTGKYYFDVGIVAEDKAKAIVSQLRLLDRNRLINHIGTLDATTFNNLIDRIVEVNLKKVPPRPLRGGGEPEGRL